MLIAKLFHILGFTVWIGGMFFAHHALRPSAASILQPPQRLPLLAAAMARFFMWAWIAIALIMASGLYMMALLGRPALFVTLMFVIGVVMMLIFAHLFFAPNRRLQRAVTAQDWPAAGAAMAHIRTLVHVNLMLGLITIVIGTLGPLV
jgi:uncharacterized membrane protein